MGTSLNVSAWSTTAASNNTADSGLPTIADTMAPTDVDDALRGIMAAVRRYASDVGGGVTVGGTADAITITTSSDISAAHEAAGFSLRFKAGGTNTGPVTVNVDGEGAEAIERMDGSALSAGDIITGGIYDIAYNATNGGYTLLNSQNSSSSNLGATTSSFSAHKNGTDQTVSTTNPTKVTFGTEIYDVGSDFASSRWTPPAGTVLMSAAVALEDNADNTKKIIIYKNGSEFKRTLLREDAGAGTLSTFITIMDQANGTDYYEVYCELASDSSYTISGLATNTFFMGTMI